MLKLIDTARPFGPFGNPHHITRIYQDTTCNEYRVRLFVAGKLYEPADYFTDDIDDARDTAIAMLG